MDIFFNIIRPANETNFQAKHLLMDRKPEIGNFQFAENQTIIVIIALISSFLLCMLFLPIAGVMVLFLTIILSNFFSFSFQKKMIDEGQKWVYLSEQIHFLADKIHIHSPITAEQMRFPYDTISDLKIHFKGINDITGENLTFFQWKAGGAAYQYFILTDVAYHKDLLISLLLFFQRKQIHFEELNIISLLSKKTHSLEVDENIQRLIDEIGT